MSWSEKRIVTALSSILLALCVILLVVLGIRYHQNRNAQQTDIPAPPVDETGEVAAFSALSYYDGKTTLSFSRNESGTWVWSDDPSFPLNNSTITQITDWLTAWNPLETITDPTVIANSGVDEPDAYLNAMTPTGALSIVFGKKTDAGYYVRLNKDTSTVYVIAPSLYELMSVPIYDMCMIPELPVLQEKDILSIVITGAITEGNAEGLSTVLTAQRAENDDESVSWRSSGANVTDDPRVQALLADLTALSFEKCILYRPSEEAASICGFDNPAKLSVSYMTEADSDGSVDLVIGASLPDGSGRYVRLGEDSTIYLLPTDVLDPLMHISVVGLDG